jgi:hypothetical protein
MNHTLLLDFDHTLFDTDRFVHDLYEALLQDGCTVEQSTWEETAKVEIHNGYTFEAHAKAIEKAAGVASFSHKQAELVFTKRFSNVRQYLYADVLRFLARAEAERFIPYIVSAGNPSWQEYKIEASGLGAHIPAAHRLYVTDHTPKALVIEERFGATPGALFIDNKGKELDAVREHGLPITTWFMKRSVSVGPGVYSETRRIAEQGSAHAHETCSSLDEVVLNGSTAEKKESR